MDKIKLIQYIIIDDKFYEDDTYIFFFRSNYVTNYNLIKLWGCKWCSKDTNSWEHLLEKGKLYGIIEKQTQTLYSLYILHDGSIRRFIDSEHKNITNNKITSDFIKKLKNIL